MKKSIVRVLHITPHLGGGVGRVLLNYFLKVKKDFSYAHSLACLDYANDQAVKIAKNANFPLFDKISKNKQKLLNLIADSDIVLIHWWNHPLLYDFLVRQTLPPSRVIFWSHISGFNPPCNFTKKILQYPDIFVFTTPVSFKTKEVKNLSIKDKKKFQVIWSTGGVETFKSIKPKKHSGFNIGYIGTVDYAKIHPNFLSICKQINIPRVKFIVCGGPNENIIKKEAEKLGIAKKFIFTGHVSNVKYYLSIFDVFGYPLAPYHYGTCDQTLQEAMAAGVVPVVLANPMERYMVKNGVTGIVAKNKNEYAKAVRSLYNNKVLRNSLSRKAKEYALKTFSINTMNRQWKTIFKKILTLPKTQKSWMISNKNKLSAADVFLESLGDYGKIFTSFSQAQSKNERTETIKKISKLKQSNIWKANTRGTAHHYHSFFPNDQHLYQWSQLMKKV